MADTLYAFTDIVHGYVDGDNGVKQVRFSAGEEFKADHFTQEEVASLIEHGALSRVDRTAAELPELTTNDAMGIVSGVTEDPNVPEDQKPGPPNVVTDDKAVGGTPSEVVDSPDTTVDGGKGKK